MTRHPLFALAAPVVLAVLAVASGSAQSPLPPLPMKLRDEIRASTDLGLRYLRWQQNQQNGSWDDNAETTALGLDAFVRSHRRYNEEDGPFIRGPLAYVTSAVAPLSPVSTVTPSMAQRAATVLALKGLGKASFQPIVSQGAESIAASIERAVQAGAAVDAFELSLALAALRVSDVPREHAVWNQAATLVDRATASADGIDGAAARVYGLLASGVSKTDPRVAAAWGSLKRNYSADPFGKTEIDVYLRYQVLVRALREYGEPAIEDARGAKHDWRDELSKTIVGRQQFDGSWTPGAADSAGGIARTTALAIAALELFYN